MIRRLRGTVIDRWKNVAVIDVQGVGYGVTVPERLALASGIDVDLYVFTHVREDAINLFGFLRRIDLEVFELLITVPMIGPVKAMGILEATAEDLITLVRSKDLSRLSKLPGVGKKTAERIVVDLFEKLSGLELSSQLPIALANHAALKDLISALVNLGFRPSQAEDAAKRTLDRVGNDASIEVLLKESLTQLTAR